MANVMLPSGIGMSLNGCRNRARQPRSHPIPPGTPEARNRGAANDTRQRRTTRAVGVSVPLSGARSERIVAGSQT
jgi:hypothetical protein